MDSRTPEERKVDEVIRDIKLVFNMLGKKIQISDCVSIVKRLNNASKDAPNYKRDEIIPLLMNAYYYQVKFNHYQKNYLDALYAARAFHDLGTLDAGNYFYKFYIRYQEEIGKLLPELEEKSQGAEMAREEKAREKERAMKEKYFDLVLSNWEKNTNIALDAGKNYLKLFKSPPKNDPAYKKVQDAMLAIHARRVAQMRRSAQIKKDVDQTPAVKAYRSLEAPFFPVPRTPKPTKLTNSLTHKKPSTQKPRKGVSKSLHLSGSGSSINSNRKKK